ncbi:MAG TPA: alcohol dehydrogenase catalytic domain-containing protein [Vicinamibacterales bacterium]|nr:alcohol dehydrogenase catalytic domain-containing protein [Vicinamibacterales bacterium]
MIGLAKLAPGPGNVAITEREERPPARGEVIIEVHGAGICGTDLHIEAGEFQCRPPVTMGHEVSGVVSAVGETVDPSWLGTSVVSETYYSTCGHCAWCREGQVNLCPERRSIGSFVDGAFARQLVVPAANLHRIPGWLDEHAAVLIEPLACVCQCLCDPSRVAPGDRVLVTGPGPVGLLAAQVARAFGGEVSIVGLPRDEARLAVARNLGFATAHAAQPGAQVVIECSGAAGGAATCFEAAGRGARYVQVGVFGRDVTVPLDNLFRKELVMTSGFASTPRSWRRAMSLVETRRVALEPLVSYVAPLADWQGVFADLRSGRGLKIVFDPRLQ